MSIRNKLTLMLVVPLLALAIVGAFGFRAQSTVALDAETAFEQDQVAQSLNTLVKMVGAERLGLVGPLESSRTERQASTDEAFEFAIDTAGSVRGAEGLVEGIEAIATDVQGARQVATSGRIDVLNDATTGIRALRDSYSVQYPSAEALAGAESIDLSVDIADIQDIAWIDYISAQAFADDAAANALVPNLVRAGAEGDLLRSQILRVSPPSHVAPLEASIFGPFDAALTRLLVESQDRALDGSPAIDSNTAFDTLLPSHNDWYEHAIMIQSDVSTSLQNDATSAGDTQALFALMATLGLLILFGLVYVVYRSVVRPLNELLEGAEEVATQRLPAMVAGLRDVGASDDAAGEIVLLDKETDDELGSLVDAFNDVQLTAAELAIEQAKSRRNIAEMFINLGRRNQKLLQRILRVISELEKDEADPEKLEDLFQLDHMATRMRRNAESLLVLAGMKTPRQWAKPVPAADVVRGALAEVEDYHRIDIGEMADAPMSGSAVADITHLLAELLENALQFSEANTRVDISARMDGGDYKIFIADRGFGMTDTELDEANERMASPPPVDQAPTRFLGLFVVGHLAKRHGIEVKLLEGADSGTMARLVVPASLLVAERVEDETSPLVSDADLDAELAGLTNGDLPMRDAPVEPAAPTIDGLPVRGESTDTDDLPVRGGSESEELDDLPVRGESEATASTDVGDLPVRGADADAPDLGDLPVRGEAATDSESDDEDVELPLNDLPVRGDTPASDDSSPLNDLPVRGESISAELEDLPVRGETSDESGDDLPELEDLPVRGESPAVELDELPVRPEESSVPDDLDGLPTRAPLETLRETGVVPVEPILANASVRESEPEDVSDSASAFGSMMSAFTTGVQRGAVSDDADDN